MLYFVDTLKGFASFCNIFMLFILLPYSFCSQFNTARVLASQAEAIVVPNKHGRR